MAGLTAIGIGIAVGAAVSAISYGIQVALAPTPKKPLLSGRIDNLRTIRKDNTAPLRVVYGTYRASGVLLFARSVNPAGDTRVGARFLHFTLALAHGPINDIYDIQLNDEPADSTRFSNLAALIPFLGFRDQAMFRGPIELLNDDGGFTTCQLPTEWLDAYRPLREVAYLWGLLRHDPDVFPGGAPNVRATMEGRLVYDPREDVSLGGAQTPEDTSTHRFSNNWALCVRDFLTSPVYGFGISHGDIDDDATIEAANISDELISAPSDTTDENPNPTIKRYTIDTLFETDEQPIDILAKLLTAGAGALLVYGGKFRIKAGAPEPAALDITSGQPITLDENDLRDDEDIQLAQLPGRKDRVNTVRGTFINPDKQYLPDQFPTVTHEAFLDQDGNVELSSDLQFDCTQHVDRAQYLAGIFLKRQRLGRVIWPAKPGKATQLTPLSRIRINLAHFGWANKEFQVRNWERLPNAAINLHLEEYDPNTWEEGINPATRPPTTTLPGPFDLFPPTNVLAFEETQTNPDGTRVSRIVVTWEEPADGLVEGYQVSWRQITPTPGTTQAQRIPAPATQFVIQNLPIGLYVVTVASTLNAKVSEAVALQVEVTYRSAAPPDPVDLRVQQSGTHRRLAWRLSAPRPPDLVGYEIRLASGSVGATIADFDAARVLATVRTENYETTRPTMPGTYTFLIRSVDSSATFSNGVATVTVTLEPSEPSIVYEHEFSEDGWTGTIANARVNDEGHLEGIGGLTWATAGSWAAMLTWNRSGASISFTSPIIDLGLDRAVAIQNRVELRNGGVRIMVRSRLDAEQELGHWHAATGAVGRYIQLQLTAFSTTSAPVIERFFVRIAEHLTDDAKGDINMATLGNVLQLARVERMAAEWNTGPWQVNIKPVPTGSMDLARAECEPETSLEFDGITGIVTAIDHPKLRLQTGALTIEALIKPNTLAPGTLGVIIGKGTDWRIRQSTSGTIGLILNNAVVAGSEITLPDAFGIHHVAFSIGQGLLRTYLDAALVATVNIGPLSITPSSTVVRLGASQSGALFYAGLMEEVRVWNVARTIDEIRRDATAHADPNAPGLVGYWRGADGSGGTVRDLSPTAANGVISGGVTYVRAAYRESPPINLALIPAYAGGTALWGPSSQASGCTVAVQMSTNNGVNWVSVGTGTAVPGILFGDNPAGKTLRIRQFLKSTVIANSPVIEHINVVLTYVRATGDLIVQGREPFLTAPQATIEAIQDTLRPAAWNVVARDPIAARFRVYDALTQQPMDAIADVRLRGVRL